MYRERTRASQRGLARSARWIALGVSVIVLSCSGDAETDGDTPDPADGNAPNAARRAPLGKAGECIWVKVAECSSRVTIADWCGPGFYAATLQRCPDVGGSLFSVSDFYSSLQATGCRPTCPTDLTHVTLDAVECCADGIPGTPVPDEPEEQAL